jgi:DUF4097 and DUF4098 domain-containing protein YvlB
MDVPYWWFRGCAITSSLSNWGVGRLGAILLFGSLLSATAFAEDWNKHWDTGAKPELRVHAGDAAVVITAGATSGIDAHLTTRGYTIGRSGVQIIEHQTGDAVDLEVRVPDTYFHLGEKSIRLELRVPRELTADVHTGDGSIRLIGLSGNLRVDTGDGSIRGEDLDGSLEARSGDGSVHVAGRFDNLQLHTQDGSVELDARSGSAVRSAWHLETGDGSVRLSLPANFRTDLEMRTGDGQIKVDVPGLAEQKRTEHEVRARLNGGGNALLIRTGDGSITIKGR